MQEYKGKCYKVGPECEPWEAVRDGVWFVNGGGIPVALEDNRIVRLDMSGKTSIPYPFVNIRRAIEVKPETKTGTDLVIWLAQHEGTVARSPYSGTRFWVLGGRLYKAIPGEEGLVVSRPPADGYVRADGKGWDE